MSITTGFLILVALTTLERGIELVIGTRNRAWSLIQGGVEHGQGHWPWMVALHTAFLGLMVAEVLMMPTTTSLPLALSMLGLALGAQGLRWWCIRTLGRRWNPRVIVIPGLPRITDGPYRWLRHPNYLAVIIEGIALPMVHGGWRTAVFFTASNAILLWVRIGCENRALQTLDRT